MKFCSSCLVCYSLGEYLYPKNIKAFKKYYKKANNTDEECFNELSKTGNKMEKDGDLFDELESPN